MTRPACCARQASGERDIGNYDAFIPLPAAIQAMESAAEATATPDFGRRLAQRQGIEILGPVGVAARTAATVADALGIFSTYMAAYSPVIAIPSHRSPTRSGRSSRSNSCSKTRHRTHRQSNSRLGVSLRVLRFLMGADYTALAVHLPHDPLTSEASYVQYFGCTPYFAERTAGFTVRTADLGRPLNRDDVAHRAVVDYLSGITPSMPG